MKKLPLILFLISNLVMAQDKIVPVAEYTASNTDWQSNLYDIYYVACRCGFAYQAAYEEMIKHTKQFIFIHTGKDHQDQLVLEAVILVRQV